MVYFHRDLKITSGTILLVSSLIFAAIFSGNGSYAQKMIDHPGAMNMMMNNPGAMNMMNMMMNNTDAMRMMNNPGAMNMMNMMMNNPGAMNMMNMMMNHPGAMNMMKMMMNNTGAMNMMKMMMNNTDAMRMIMNNTGAMNMMKMMMNNTDAMRMIMNNTGAMNMMKMMMNNTDAMRMIMNNTGAMNMMKMMMNNTEKISDSNDSAAVLVQKSGISKPNPEVSIVLGASNPSSGLYYQPDSLTVSAGTTVIWTNHDNTIHTVTQGNPEDFESDSLFDSGILATGKTFSFKFSDKGIYDYYCTLHPFMKGSITVN